MVINRCPYLCIKSLAAIITFVIFASAASRTTLKPKQLMVKSIYSSLWTPRRSAAHSRTEVTCFSLNQGIPFLWNSSIPIYSTSEEWEREETLFRLIQPWNIASLLNVLQSQQRMWCVLSGRVRWRYFFILKKYLNPLNTKDTTNKCPRFCVVLFYFCHCPFQTFFLPFSSPFSRFFYSCYLLHFISFLTVVNRWVLTKDKE